MGPAWAPCPSPTRCHWKPNQPTNWWDGGARPDMLATLKIRSRFMELQCFLVQHVHHVTEQQLQHSDKIFISLGQSTLFYWLCSFDDERFDLMCLNVINDERPTGGGTFSQLQSENRLKQRSQPLPHSASCSTLTGVKSKRLITSLISDEADQDLEERDTKILSATNQAAVFPPQSKILRVGHDVTWLYVCFQVQTTLLIR